MRLKITNRCDGFTLIELMIAIVVLSILVGIGVPSYRTMVNNSRVTSQVNDFVTSLSIARSEAIKSGSSVSVTAADGDWTNGWTINASDGTLLRTESAIKNYSTLVAEDGTTSITYDSRGFNSSGSAVTLNLCNTNANSDRQVSITPGGRVNMDSHYDCEN